MSNDNRLSKDEVLCHRILYESRLTGQTRPRRDRAVDTLVLVGRHDSSWNMYNKADA